jgi:hypothetical protein
MDTACQCGSLIRRGSQQDGARKSPIILNPPSWTDRAVLMR